MLPTTVVTAPHPEKCGKTQPTEPGTTPTTRPTNNRLPQFDQVREVASLQPQNIANHPKQIDPLEKYSSGITQVVHEPYPSSAYANIKQEVLDDQRTMDGETLLAIPFGSDAEMAELHNDTGDCIFDAVGEITHSKS